MKRRRKKYWIEILDQFVPSGHAFAGYDYYTWVIRCINGRQKAAGNRYDKYCLCFNDAKALADYTGLQIRYDNKVVYYNNEYAQKRRRKDEKVTQ